MASNLEAISKIGYPIKVNFNYQLGLDLNQVISGRAAHPIQRALPFWHFEANPQ